MYIVVVILLIILLFANKENIESFLPTEKCDIVNDGVCEIKEKNEGNNYAIDQLNLRIDLLNEKVDLNNGIYWFKVCLLFFCVLVLLINTRNSSY